MNLIGIGNADGGATTTSIKTEIHEEAMSQADDTIPLAQAPLPSPDESMMSPHSSLPTADDTNDFGAGGDAVSAFDIIL